MSTSQTSLPAGRTEWPSTLSYTNTGKRRPKPAQKYEHAGVLPPLLFFFPRPDLVDYNKLKRSNPTHNLQSAFSVAEQKLGVTKLLDPEGK